VLLPFPAALADRYSKHTRPAQFSSPTVFGGECAAAAIWLARSERLAAL
jgi:hypothetical protein